MPEVDDYGGTGGTFATWMNSNNITPVATGVNPTATDAGELSMVQAASQSQFSGQQNFFGSDDVSFFNPNGSGAAYVPQTLQIQDLGNDMLSNGTLNIEDYITLSVNNATMNKGNPDVTQFFDQTQAFNATPYAQTSGQVASESGTVTDTKTGVTYSIQHVLQNVLTDESGGASVTGLANFLDTATLQNVLANTAVTGAGGALAALGIAAITADILQTAAAAQQQIDQGNYGAAAADIDSLAARTGTAVAAADAGFVAGAALASSEEVAAAWAAGDIALDALIVAGVTTHQVANDNAPSNALTLRRVA